MANETICYIGLGSNLGDREEHITRSLKILAGTEGIELLRTSDVLETSPLAGADQPKYLNAVTEINTTLTAEALFNRLAEIEDSLGRVREKKWSPRTIDLDLLLFDRQVINTSDLTVPHPQMHLRSFVLTGLCQLNSELIHPVLSVTVSELASRLNGCDFVLNRQLPQLISIAGLIGVGKTTLTKKLAERLDCTCIFEPYQENPFMPDVYAGKKQFALDSELFWLTSRAEQLKTDMLKKAAICISDYIFEKTRIYAEKWLNDRQMDLYENISPPFSSMAAQPVLVVYLKDSGQNCLDRIVKRNRPYEQKIELPFLEALEAGYEKLLSDWKTCPVMRLQKSKFDYMNDANIDNLTNQIKNYVAV